MLDNLELLHFMFMRYIYYFFLAAIIFLSSCSTQEKLRKELVYFNQGLDSAAFGNFILEEPTIQKGDLLQIIISSRSSSANLLFSQNVVSSNVGMNTPAQTWNNPQANQYMVDIGTGDIKLPTLGTIHAEGLTKSQLEKEIIKLCTAYVSDQPVINIRYLNFRVTFLGNVANPGTKLFETERVTFLQALGEVGGISPGGDLKNILLFREKDGKRTIHKIDLTSVHFINSSENYLKQNDVVYVAPTDRQLTALDITVQRRLQLLALGLSMVNILLLITNFFR
jgi:polysaccharide export outer membrane protein